MGKHLGQRQGRRMPKGGGCRASRVGALRRRGEVAERSFAHFYGTRGMRRSHLGKLWSIIKMANDPCRGIQPEPDLSRTVGSRQAKVHDLGRIRFCPCFGCLHPAKIASEGLVNVDPSKAQIASPYRQIATFRDGLLKSRSSYARRI